MALFERDFQMEPLEVTYLLSFLQRDQCRQWSEQNFSFHRLCRNGDLKVVIAFVETHKEKKLQMSYHRPEIPRQVERIFVKGEQK